MSSLTLRKLDNGIKLKLQRQATLNGRSIETEACIVLAEIFANESKAQKGLATTIQNIVNKNGGLEISQPKRKANPSQRQLDFSDEAYG